MPFKILVVPVRSGHDCRDICSIKTPDALILATALEQGLAFVSRDKQLRFARDEYGLAFIEP